MRRALPSLLLIAALVWATLLIASPAYVASRDVGSGPPPPKASARLAEARFAREGGSRTFSLSATSIYLAASFICHQRPERSFHVRGVKMPVCARCTALYLAAPFGIALALAAASPPGRRRPDVLRRFLIAAALPIVLTLAIEWTGAADPGNVMRAASAVPLGVLVGWLVTSAARGELDHRAGALAKAGGPAIE